MTNSIAFHLDLNEISFSFTRSSGSGGQNVNKVNSKAVLRFPIKESQSLQAAVKERFYQKYPSFITQEGDVLIASDRFRDQPRNRQDCVDKLLQMITSVFLPPKKRKKTRPSKSSVAQHKHSKKVHSSRKQSRRRVSFED